MGARGAAHGEHALLVPVEAPAVADALERALADPAMGARGRRLVEATMGREAQLTRLGALYRELLG